MILRRFLLATLGVAVAVAVRPALAVRTIRWLDQRGGLATTRAQGGYSRIAGIFGGLHERAASDIAAIAADRPLAVLDVGAGPGDLAARLQALAPLLRVTAVEPSPEMRAIAEARGITELAGRAEGLPVADGSVDVLVSTLSSHHWSDVVAALREASRVLAPGGQARIYDVRFAGYGPDEIAGLARRAAVDPGRVHHEVLDERVLGWRPYSLITLDAATAA